MRKKKNPIIQYTPLEAKYILMDTLIKEGKEDYEVGPIVEMATGTVRNYRTGNAGYGEKKEKLGLSNDYKDDPVTAAELKEIMEFIIAHYPNCVDNEASIKFGRSITTIKRIRLGEGHFAEMKWTLHLPDILYNGDDNLSVTDDEIVIIMEMVKQGYTDKEIGLKLNKPERLIRNVRTGAGIYGVKLKALGYEPVEKSSSRKVSDEDILLIYKLYGEYGKSLREIKDVTKYSEPTIRLVLRAEEPYTQPVANLGLKALK